MSRTVSFTENTYAADKPIIVYGASVYGELAYFALEQMGNPPITTVINHVTEKNILG